MNVMIYLSIMIKNVNYPPIELKYSNIHVFKKVDVGWGEDSQIECEMFLFNEAYKKGPFDYYHLLSGVDLPLKSNYYIHDFFDQNKGKEFVGIMDEQSCFICYKGSVTIISLYATRDASGGVLSFG